MKQYVIIAAGGVGTRMGSSVPKQLLLLHKKPIIVHTIQRFVATLPAAEIIVASPVDYIEELQQIFITYNVTAKIVAGGHTRFHSVKNALDIIIDNGVVLVHDAARCLVDAAIILNSVSTALSKGNAIPVVSCTDTVRWITDTENKLLDRNNIKLVQTPQAFLVQTLKEAFNKPYVNSFTDEASVMEASGHDIHTIEGSYQNIKVTNPIDLQIASLFLAK